MKKEGILYCSLIIIAISFMVFWLLSLGLTAETVIIHQGLLASATKTSLTFKDGYIFNGSYSLNQNEILNNYTLYELEVTRAHLLWILPYTDHYSLVAIWRIGK